MGHCVQFASIESLNVMAKYPGPSNFTYYLSRPVIGHCDDSCAPDSLAEILAESIRCSGIVTKPTIYCPTDDIRLKDIVRRLRMLRLVVERKPVTTLICKGYSVKRYIETLSCGHEIVTYFPNAAECPNPAKRRNCKACCAELQSSPKRPIAVPESPSPRKTGAA